MTNYEKAKLIMEAMQHEIIEFDNGCFQLQQIDHALSNDVQKNGFLETSIQEYLSEYFRIKPSEKTNYENYLEFCLSKRTEKIIQLQDTILDQENQIIELENQIIDLLKEVDPQ